MMAYSMDSGTLERTTRTLGTGCEMDRASTAIALKPVNGGSPTSISYSTQPSA